MFKINNLTYQYEKESLALNNISMDFSNGDVIGIIGSNGSGKSTLFMNLMGIIKPKSGEILFREKPLKYDKKSLYELRKNAGIVFQDPEKQIFYSKVYDDIAFSLRNIGLDEDTIRERITKALKAVNGMDFINKPIHFLSYGQKKRVAIASVIAMEIDEDTIRERITKALKAVNGMDFINKPIHFLSYGQKKRVAIASVIAMENEIVLLDEPTAGLDPVSTRLIVDIIKGLKENGIKIVISSHDMNLMYEICDYMYILNKGSISSHGAVEDVFLNEELIKEAGLELPWLVKIHKNMNLPLFRAEEGLYKYWNEQIACDKV